MPPKEMHPYFPQPKIIKIESNQPVPDRNVKCRVLDEEESSISDHLIHNAVFLENLLWGGRLDSNGMQHYAAFFVTHMLLSMKGESLLKKAFPETSLIGYLGFWNFNMNVVGILDEKNCIIDFRFPRVMSAARIDKISKLTKDLDFSSADMEYRATEKLLNFDRKRRGTIESDLYALGVLTHNLFYAKPSATVRGRNSASVVMKQLKFSNPSENEIRESFERFLPRDASGRVDYMSKFARRVEDILMEKRTIDERLCGVDAHVQDWVSEPARALIKAMVSISPSKRKSIDDLLRMPFFSDKLLAEMLDNLSFVLDINEELQVVAPLVSRALDGTDFDSIVSHMLSRLRGGHPDWFDMFHIAVLKKFAPDEYKQSIKIIREVIMPFAITKWKLQDTLVAKVMSNVKLPLPLPESYINEVVLKLLDGMRESANRIREAKAKHGLFLSDRPSPGNVRQEQPTTFTPKTH